MHNIAEGYDSESNAEFIRFLRYAKRSCSEVQSQLYVALDNDYIASNKFDAVYELARRTRAATRGFINYLVRSSKDGPNHQVDEDPQNYNP
jgi:four helix bundle protein